MYCFSSTSFVISAVSSSLISFLSFSVSVVLTCSSMSFFNLLMSMSTGTGFDSGCWPGSAAGGGGWGAPGIGGVGMIPSAARCFSRKGRVSKSSSLLKSTSLFESLI